MRKLFSATILAVMVALAGCASSPMEVSELKPKTPTKDAVTAEQLANLVQVDTSAAATGPSVHELLTIEDVEKILGRDDIVFAEAT